MSPPFPFCGVYTIFFRGSSANHDLICRVEARADILRIHSRSMNLTRGINLTKIAEKMNGCSGAELKGVCTEAGMYALRERRVHVTQEDFDLATAKILNKHDDKEVAVSKLWK